MTKRFFGLVCTLLFLTEPAASYQIGTIQENGSAQFRGQVFVPSSPGVTPDDRILPSEQFPPLGLNGQAYLSGIALRIATDAQAPAMIHFFAQLPSASQATSGEGALASATLRICRGDGGPGQACDYGIDPLELPFDQPVFAVFSECATAVVSAASGDDDYPAGQPILDSNCAAPESGSLSLASGPGDVAFVASFLNPTPNRIADYQAGNGGQGNGDNVPPLSGPSLGSTSNELIDGRLVPTHDMAGGVALPTSVLIPAGNFVLSALLRLDDTQGFRKLLDFKNLKSDNGIYANNGELSFFPFTSSGQSDLAEGAWQSLVVERIDNLVRIRLDAEFKLFVIDNAQDALPDADQLLNFFVDDQTTGGVEDPLGRWARIQLFQNISGLQGPPPRLSADGADPFENDNLPSRADLGQNGPAGSFRTFHVPDDEDWLYGGVPCDIPNYWGETGNAALVVSSDDPRFAPIVEYYPQAALADPMAQPTETFGSCATRERLVIPPIIDSFVRLRNCENPTVSPAAPIRYEINSLQPDAVVCSPALLIRGTVTEAGSGNPVGGVFILGEDNSAGFSSPTDGAYRILVTDFDQMTLNVISTAWTAPTTVVESIDLLNGAEVNFEVSRRSVLFGDGFEDRENPFAGAGASP
ncbi:MAG: hypothetical protein AAF358_02760 [Pseudomonadota bacterium]